MAEPRERELKTDALIELIETHRAPETPVHLARTIGDVRRDETFGSARDAGFSEALRWGGIGTTESTRSTLPHSKDSELLE